MYDGYGDYAIHKLYGNNNPQASDWLRGKVTGWSKLEQDRSEGAYKTLKKSITRLRPDEQVSDNLMHAIRKHFQDEVTAKWKGTKSLSTTEYQEDVDHGFGMTTHDSFLEHPGLNEVVPANFYESDTVDTLGDHGTSGGDIAECCTIL